MHENKYYLEVCNGSVWALLTQHVVCSNFLLWFKEVNFVTSLTNV